MRSLLATLLLLPSLALAQAPTYSELTNARGVGMGGAYRGSGLGADAVLGNPAALAALKVYQFELTGAWDPKLHEGFGGVSIRDSQTSDVGAGADYHYLSVHDAAGNRRNAHLGTIAFGFPLAQAVLLGASGKYLYATDGKNISAATVDAGLVVQPMEGLSIGLSGHNLVNTHHVELSRYYSTQLAYTAGLFSAEFDVSGDPGRDGGLAPLYNVGAEYVLGSAYPLEAGFTSNTLTGAKYVSGGLGVFGEGGGLDLAYRHQTNGNSRLIVLTLRLLL